MVHVILGYFEATPYSGDLDSFDTKIIHLLLKIMHLLLKFLCLCIIHFYLITSEPKKYMLKALARYVEIREYIYKVIFAID